MRRFRCFLAPFACAVAASSATAQITPAPQALHRLIQSQIQGRLDAAARADSISYRAFIDPDLVFITDDGSRATARQRLRQIAGRPVGHSRYVIDSVTVTADSQIAIADYLVTEFVRYGDRELPGPGRGVDIYARHGDTWLMRAHGEAPLLTLPEPVPVDAATLADYVGDYEWWPSHVDRIRLERGALVEQSPDDPAPLPLRAATPESFFLDGDPSLLTFVRNRSGAVTGYVIHFPTGQVISARRVR